MEINPVNEIQEIGCEIHFAIPDSDTAVIYLQDLTVLPCEIN